MRSHDPFGRMKVEWTNISKANVCPYLGREIPGWQQLGLDSDRIYKMWRHPDELKKAAPSFDMVPILDEHVVVDAAHPEKESVAGTTGTGTRFVFPYLQTPMAIWVADSIGDVKSKRKRELSPGYGYKPDMTSGVTPEGVAYDGVMRHIVGNHVALVREGRTGPDVMVADELPPEISPMKRSDVTPLLVAAMAGVVLTADQTVALDAALDAAMCTAEQKAAAKAKEAMDAKDMEDNPDSWEDDPAKKGSKRKKTKIAKDAVVAVVVPPVEKGTTDMITKAEATKLATDAADAAVKAALAAQAALFAARKDVEEVVGAVTLDSAEAVYRHALKAEKVDGHETIHESALPAVWAQVRKSKGVSTKIATDAALAPDAASAVAAIGF